MMRVYGLDLEHCLTVHAIQPTMLADLLANLPDGSMLWRAMDLPNAWTTGDYLTATLVDQMNMWMWGNADRNRRGHRPQPVPRPGAKRRPQSSDVDADTEHTSRHIGVHAMTVTELDRFMR